MKLKEILRHIQNCLSHSHIDDYKLEAELLLRHALDQNAIELFLSYDRMISDKEQLSIQTLLDRRLNGEPLAYIVGRREFYKLSFIVNSHVLIPRPETELLVEKAIVMASAMSSPVIADIGTGSGAIAVTLAVNLHDAKVYAVDISPEALDVARDNAIRHTVAPLITFVNGDLLKPLPEAVDLLVANLPYVKSNDCSNSAEPHLALDGGAQGLVVIKRLCAMLPDKIRKGGSVLLEIGYGQAEDVVRMLQSYLPSARIETIRDLAGIERVVCGHL
ncbi:MAG: peptide chain release factor N(5)-glutamine methyltransferase [Dehalococcoidia bacterium]|nr:peptide chain release factor N(5)-glutamine methyltransferase [Dehalococcoidia bacterium]